MKHLIHAALIAIILLGTLSACQQTGAGPRSWIDQPLDNETFPFQALTLQAHASDEDGVKDIEFLVDDQSVVVINAGGERMGKALFEWTPPGPGVYIIYAQAVDNNGNLGDAASSQITIVDQVAQIPLDEPDQPELKQDEEEEKDIQVAEEPVEEEKDIQVAEEPVEGAQAPALPEEPPAEEPPETPPETPPEEPPPEPPPDEDNDPPTITSVSVSPETIYQNGCSGDVQTTIITVEAIDIGGITNVEAAWSIGSESGQAILNYVGANRYQATLGPFNTKGTLTIYGSVVDGSGNWTPFITTVNVDCCIC